MKRICKLSKIFSRNTLIFRYVQANITPTQSFFFFLYYSSVQRERERADIPPAHKHVDRLISMNKNYYDWLKNSIGRASMQKHIRIYVMIFFSYKRRRKRERVKKRDGKASVPASFCSSFVIATSILSSIYTKKNSGNDNGDSISLNRALHFRKSSFLCRSSTRFQGSPGLKGVLSSRPSHNHIYTYI
jgi:hypothetical protein